MTGRSMFEEEHKARYGFAADPLSNLR